MVIWALMVGAVAEVPDEASAHAPYGTVVARVPDFRPVPVVDGRCGEYASAPALARLLYPGRPRSAPARLLATSSHLYVCIADMPADSSSRVHVAFDAAHDRWLFPLGDDWRFTIDESGVPASLQGGAPLGSGQLFVSTPLSGFSAARTTEQGKWHAEFRIPVGAVGGGTPLSVTGMEVGHDSPFGLRSQWPPGARPGFPSSWADVVWGAFPSSARVGRPALDVTRTTQGLEFDAEAAVPYRLIAGKDTLVRAQLYTHGAPGNVTYAACVVDTPDGRTFRLPALGMPSRTINLYPAGFFDGSPVFECWLNGTSVSAAGRYVVRLEVRIDGLADPQVLFLDDPTFVRSGDLRVLLVPFQNRFGSNTRGWGNDLAAAIAPTMAETARLLPVERGAGAFDWSGTRGASKAGLRYYVWPTVLRCTDTESMSECGARVGSQILNAMRSSNEQLRARDSADGRNRDRFDYSWSLTLTTASSGGADCAFGDDVIAPLGEAGAGGDYDGNIATSGGVLAHELSHCLAQVRTTSPHYTPGGHSGSSGITMVRGRPLVNTRTRADVASPAALMRGVLGDFHEGFEWNDVRSSLMTAARPSALRHTQQARAATTLFHVSGYLTDDGRPIVLESKRKSGIGMQATAQDPGGPLTLAFLDPAGHVVSTHGFRPRIPHTHGVPAPNGSFVIDAPLPRGATSVEIRDGSVVRFRDAFSASRPVMERVTVKPGRRSVTASWRASDPDGDALTYDVFVAARRSQGKALIASGLAANSYSMPAAVALATSRARMIVVASDGFLTDAMKSKPFAIRRQPPAVTIASPRRSDRLLAGARVKLLAGVYDNSTRTFPGRRLSWRSSIDGLLGKGARRTVRLSAGRHRLTLRARTHFGRTAVARTLLRVARDSDRDGLANAVERDSKCLAPTRRDSHRDPDGDGLKSFAESGYGTQPCAVDSDADGFADGDEVRLGAGPTDANSAPARETMLLDDRPLDLGRCPNPRAASLTVEGVSPFAGWLARSDSRWLTVRQGQLNTIEISVACNSVAAGPNLGHVLIGALGELRVIDARYSETGRSAAQDDASATAIKATPSRNPSLAMCFGDHLGVPGQSR